MLCFESRPGKLLQFFFTRLVFLLLLLTSLPVFAQQTKAISGTITDDTGKPVAGATVSVKGKATGTKSDEEGKFAISIAERGVLAISSVGYETQELVVDARVIYNIILKPAAGNILSDVVVIGYGTVRRKDLTGSVGTASVEDMQKAPVPNYIDALAGRVAGVQVSSNDGQPGSIANIVIRGSNSLTQANGPLYVVDGFPLEDGQVNSINPNDIATMDILKDASATAVYGARGANGVIVITTKKGKVGPPVVAVNGYMGMQKSTKTMEMMDTYEFVKFRTSLYPDDTTYINNSKYKSLEEYRNVPTLNLQDEFFQTGSFQNYDFSVRGGNDKTRYSMSGSYLDQKGIIITSAFKRMNVRMALDQIVNSKLKVGLNANYGYSIASGAPISSSSMPGAGLSVSNQSTGLLYNVWTYRPTTGVSDYDLDNLAADPAIPYLYNPVTDIQNQTRRYPNNNITGNAYLEYTLFKGLQFRSTGGITKNNAESAVLYSSKSSLGLDSIPGFARLGNGVNGSIFYTNTLTWVNENTLTYTKTIAKDHHLNSLVGASFQKATLEYRGFSVVRIPKDYETMGFDALGLASSLFGSGTSVSSNYAAQAYSSRSSQASFFGRVNYDYKSRYFLTATFRGDGSSKFAPGKRWGYFPSFAAAWRLKDEGFMKQLPVLSDAKLRASWGQTGNNRIADFAYLPQLSFANGGFNVGYNYNNQLTSGGIVTNIGNADLTWETTEQSNVGIDLSFLKNRINLTVDWYKKVTKDLLLDARLPYTAGITSAVKNIGKMQNSGLEFSLNTTNVQSGDFKWMSAFNISFNRNKILELTQGATYLVRSTNELGGMQLGINNAYNNLAPYISRIGQPAGQFYGVIFDGLYQYSDFDMLPNGSYRLKEGIPYYGTATTPKPGWAKYKDINGDGVVNGNDYTIIGRGQPIHTGGFNNNFAYKNFDLNIFFQWSYGNEILNANRIVFEAPAENFPAGINLMASMSDRWTPDNQNTNMPTGIGTNYLGYNSRVIEDGSFLRLKTIQLGYTLPQSLLSRAGFSALRFYASAQNMYTWTKYSGIDPEVSTKNSVLSPGFDYQAFPIPRTIVFGFSATF